MLHVSGRLPIEMDVLSEQSLPSVDNIVESTDKGSLYKPNMLGRNLPAVMGKRHRAVLTQYESGQIPAIAPCNVYVHAVFTVQRAE